jgi:hypothetical protein
MGTVCGSNIEGLLNDYCDHFYSFLDQFDDEMSGMNYVSTTQSFDNTSDANLNAFLFGMVVVWFYLCSLDFAVFG